MGVQIDFSKFRISRMEEGEKIEESFNCGDADLNDFILHEAPFYEKNNISLLLPNDDDKHTRLLYYDLKEE